MPWATRRCVHLPIHPMRLKRVLFAALLLLVIGFALRLEFSPAPKGDNSPSLLSRGTTTASAATPAPQTTTAITEEPAPGETVARLTYAQAWNGELPPTFAAFREWTQRFAAAGDVASRTALIPEGAALARVRRPEMLALIKSDPARALAVTVPASVRRDLPAAVLAELETRVAGRGDYELRNECDLPANGVRTTPAIWRSAYVEGVAYTAHAYGRRESQLTKEGASLHGIVLDRELALHESPVRALEAGEEPSGAISDPNRLPGFSSGKTAVGVATGARAFAAAFGRTWEFAEPAVAAILDFERRLVGAEDGVAVRVLAPDVPQVAGELATSRTTGTQRVLVLRVDFSDFPGAVLTAAEAQSIMDNNVRPFFEESSYGKTSLSTVVSSSVYRLPQTGASYAIADNETQLHTDARTLAAGDFTMANYDRIIVVFPNLGTSRVPNSLITFAGEATINGTNIWMNGTFAWQTVAHELGHTYGLYHANLWRVTDAKAISPVGTTLEYGDPFDMMGSTSATGVTRDTRHHFGPRFKNRLGWIPDTVVDTVTTSGTYRIYRFDQKNATAANRPLALRIFRDGVRWYWVGYRQNFSSGTPQANGAYVTWGYNNNQQSQLLDLTTPGTAATDATLAVGGVFNDPDYGITIKAVASGGNDPDQYLDLEITVPAEPSHVLTAWGREGALFYSGNTGLLVSPAPETAVPFDLRDVRKIAAGELHALALKADGSLVMWGDNTNGQITLPTGLAGTFADVAAGGNVSGVINVDGSVRMWGTSTGGVTTPPVGLTGVKQLVIGGAQAIGIYHALALKNDGTVVGWGDNTRGQATPPTGLTGVVAIAASDRLSVALKSDGTVVRWGTTFTGAIAFPAGLSGVAAIATNGAAEHALALKTDGTVVAWGVNTNGQATVPVGLSNVVAIATGSFHSVALKADGTVVAWGSNVNGQLNLPPALPRGYALTAGARTSFLINGPHVYLTAQPQTQTAVTGGSVTLGVGVAASAGPFTYQWRKDGMAIPGATGATLTLSGVTAASAASYDVVVSDITSALTSFPARLTVAPAGSPFDPGRLVNLSILTTVSTADPLFTVGTVVGGAGTAGTKPLLIRAAGPALTALGVTTAMSDPKLEVFSGQTVLAANDNWAGATALSNAFASVGAFSYGLATSRDAAIFEPALAKGGYTVQVSGAGGSTGTVIAEIYDSTPSSAFTATTPRLINVSLLKQIAPGDTLTTGFVVGGSSPKQVLIRVIGPTLGLAPFNISGVMADPKLDLFSGQTVINSNDNWGGGGTLATAFASVGAFALTPGSRDAAILATLPPGGYTAQVSGVGGTGGLMLVEVYEVP